MLETKIDALTNAIEALTAQLEFDGSAKSRADHALILQYEKEGEIEIANFKAAEAKEKPVKKKAVKEKPVEAAPVEADTPVRMSVEEMTRLALGMSREGKGDVVRAKLAEIGVTRIPLLEGAQLDVFETFIKEVTA